MRIYVCLKSPAEVSKKVSEIPFDIEGCAHTLREFISECVRSCIRAYIKRGKEAENPAPLSDREYEKMEAVGKFAFGVHYNKNEINEEKAIAAAVLSVSDGLVFIFKGDQALLELDDEIEISEGDVFTFIKLTLLSGRMW